MPRYIRDVREPATIRGDHTDKISPTAPLGKEAPKNSNSLVLNDTSGNKRAVNFSRQPDFSMRGEETPAFALEKQQKQQACAARPILRVHGTPTQSFNSAALLIFRRTA
jgi:hypothetical protein